MLAGLGSDTFFIYLSPYHSDVDLSSPLSDVALHQQGAGSCYRTATLFGKRRCAKSWCALGVHLTMALPECFLLHF